MKKINHLILIAFLIFNSSLLINHSQAQTKELWGVTSSGGQYNAGVIFKTDTIGNNQAIQHSFLKYEGAYPLYGNLIQASDGKLYGMTEKGGKNNNGVLFQFNPYTNSYTKKIDFEGLSNGSRPQGSLMLASDGKLYGMTLNGGANNMGVLFQYDPSTNTYSKKIDFAGLSNGSNPYGSLMQANDGKLYGMTAYGGSGGYGVLFQFDPSTNIYIKKLDFAGSGYSNGIFPQGTLTQASDGMLYGMTFYGGSNGTGVLFQYNPINNSYFKKIDFVGVTNGSKPSGNLIEGSDGTLYGMTQYGGINNYGVMFQYNPITNTYTKKIDFAGSSNGSYPNGSLVEASDGKFYGMTYHGGTNNTGVLFQYDPPTNTYVKKMDFTGRTNGANPQGSLMLASDSKLYGMVAFGGVYDNGVLYQYDPSTSGYIKKIDFEGSDNGNYPTDFLIQTSAGEFYGTTAKGGVNGYGTLFQYDITRNKYTKKIDLLDVNSGVFPTGSLMKASDGMLYGMTATGGANRMGVLFQYNPTTNSYTKKIDFKGSINGSFPRQGNSLIEASDGKLYGMTYQGGLSDYGEGALIQYDPITNICVKKIDFAGSSNGSYPYGSLIQSSDGMLYGMTESGGINNMGVLFQYDPITNVYSKKFDFAGVVNGKRPRSSLLEASNGKLYGMTGEGGVNDMGVIFQYDPTSNIYEKKVDFAGLSNGSYPNGSLIQASDGKLYGMTIKGGVYDYGVLFQYDPITNIYTKTLDFNGQNGSFPSGSLIEIEGYICNLLSDISGDNFVDVSDFLLFLDKFNENCTGCAEDIDQNGIVNIDDFLILTQEFGQPCH